MADIEGTLGKKLGFQQYGVFRKNSPPARLPSAFFMRRAAVLAADAGLRAQTAAVLFVD